MMDLPTLRTMLNTNRFMPTPPSHLHFVGDGDYKAIGAEFLEHLILHAGLSPTDRVLDIGCGVGRLAMPLTQFLGSGHYLGVDPVKTGIEWCEQNISKLYPQMQFRHIDCQHPLYNPQGTISTEDFTFTAPNSAFDLICLISVLTHLNPPAIKRYASEVARLLAPGGRCFATAFLVNAPSQKALMEKSGPLSFDTSETGPIYYAIADAPLAAVAYDEDFILEIFLRHGLRRRPPGMYGNWSGRQGESFQDICIFEKVVL